MKLKNSLNLYIAFHITNELDRKQSTDEVIGVMEEVYEDSCKRVFLDDDHEKIEEGLVSVSESERAKKQWEAFKEKHHSLNGTEVIYKIQKPLLVGAQTDVFFDKLQKVFSQLSEYYPHFTQIDEQKRTKEKDKE